MAAGGDETQLWMVPFADLMSILVILFMALFGYAYSAKGPSLEKALSTMQLELESKKPAALQERLKEAELALTLKDQLGKLGLSEMGLQVTAKRIKLTLPAPVLFQEGSERLGVQAMPVLDAVGSFLLSSELPVVVEGHTDDVPITGGRYRTNWELSAARAYSVVDHFVAKGVSAGRFSLRGYAEHRPVGDNATPEGRALNRRIEISLLRRQEKETEATR